MYDKTIMLPCSVSLTDEEINSVLMRLKNG